MEQKLVDQGFRLKVTYYTKYEAKELAKLFRKNNYYARVIKSTTAIRGICRYSVFIKERCHND